MEKSEKQRKPVALKNLAELKRFIRPGVEFKTLSQKYHPDLVGLTRVVTAVQTVCFYSQIKDQPDSRFSTDNGGKGFRTDFAKADAYIFDGTTVKVKDARNKDRGVIYEFEFYDGEQTMQENANMNGNGEPFDHTLDSGALGSQSEPERLAPQMEMKF